MKKSAVIIAVIIMVAFGTVVAQKAAGFSTVSYIPCESMEPVAASGNVRVYESGWYPGDYADCFGDDCDASTLVRCVNNVPVDSMVVAGNISNIISDNNLCRIVSGCDTVDVDISSPFPSVLDMRHHGDVKGCTLHSLSKTFQVAPYSWESEFLTSISMPDDTPLAVRDFISRTIHDTVALFFSTDNGNELVARRFPVFKMKGKATDDMMAYYFGRFRDMYVEEFGGGEEEEAWSPHYVMQFRAAPVWRNERLTTWWFMDYTYMGGAHGGVWEYYLTFDNKTGRMLGADDFFTKASYADAIAVLTRQLNDYKGNGADFSADVSADNVTEITPVLYEKRDGKRYPRPALTANGIVFTYQKYVMGSGAEGVLHFTQPYRQSER